MSLKKNYSVSSERGGPATAESTSERGAPAPAELISASYKRGAPTIAKSTAISSDRGAPTITECTSVSSERGAPAVAKPTVISSDRGAAATAASQSSKEGARIATTERNRGAITKDKALPNKEERASLKFDLKGETGILMNENQSIDNNDRTILPSTPESSYTYNLRDRSEIGQKPKFNDQFDNPASSKSYAPHLQFFQQSVSGMIDDPQSFHNHLCELHEHVVAFSFNQMSERDAIKKHGKAAILALFREFAQLHEKKVFRAIKASDLTSTQKKNALHAINLIKEKRNGILKERTCADGRKQRK